MNFGSIFGFFSVAHNKHKTAFRKKRVVIQSHCGDPTFSGKLEKKETTYFGGLYLWNVIAWFLLTHGQQRDVAEERK